MAVLNCNDVVVQVVTAGVPVLMLDTCVLLDIVRAPVRPKVQPRDIEAVETLRKRFAQSPPTISIVVDEQVLLEFADHIDEVESVTDTELKKAAETVCQSALNVAPLSACNLDPLGTGGSSSR